MQVVGFRVLADIPVGSHGARRQLGMHGWQQGLRNEGCHSARSYTSPGWEGRWSSILSGRGAGEGRGSGCGWCWMVSVPTSSKNEAGGGHQGPTHPPRPLGTQSAAWLIQKMFPPPPSRGRWMEAVKGWEGGARSGAALKGRTRH